MKYRPGFPERFDTIEASRVHSAEFFGWYNDEHRHSGIGMHTPADVHYGRADEVRRRRGIVLDGAFQAHPERFVRKPPEPPTLPTISAINPPSEEDQPTG